MDAGEAIVRMAEAAGKSRSALSVEMGRSRNFIAASLNRQPWRPLAETLADAAELCGYELVLRGRGEEIRVDGSRRQEG